MRGKAELGRLIGAEFGITPAYAGKRDCSPAFFTFSRDHPCVCGEKLR